MGFRWEREKAESNRRKHGIRFGDAIGIFTDPNAIVLLDESSDEKRYIATGMDALARVIVVVYTMRGDHFRLITARRATRRERCQYGIQNEKRVRF